MSERAAERRLPQAVLFDQDGTVVDTEPLWMQAEIDMAHAHGGTWEPADALKMIGKPLLVSAGVLIEHLSLSASPQEVAEDLVGRLAGALREQGVPWMDGAADLFERLRSHGIPFALVTSSYRAIAQEVAHRAPHGGFNAVIAGDEVPRTKPAPDPYLMAADKLGVPIEECLVIEDSPVGVTAGLSAGARVVALVGMVPVPAQAGLSRVSALEELDLDTMARIMGGEVVDTVESV